MFCGKIDCFRVDTIIKTIVTETSSSIFIVYPFWPSFITIELSNFFPMTTVKEIHTPSDIRLMTGISKTLIYPLGQQIVNRKRKWGLRNQIIIYVLTNQGEKIFMPPRREYCIFHTEIPRFYHSWEIKKVSYYMTRIKSKNNIFFINRSNKIRNLFSSTSSTQIIWISIQFQMQYKVIALREVDDKFMSTKFQR